MRALLLFFPLITTCSRAPIERCPDAEMIEVEKIVYLSHPSPTPQPAEIVYIDCACSEIELEKCNEERDHWREKYIAFPCD